MSAFKYRSQKINYHKCLMIPCMCNRSVVEYMLPTLDSSAILRIKDLFCLGRLSFSVMSYDHLMDHKVLSNDDLDYCSFEWLTMAL